MSTGFNLDRDIRLYINHISGIICFSLDIINSKIYISSKEDYELDYKEAKKKDEKKEA